MTKEELEKEAIKRVDAFIDNFSQDIRSTLHDRLNQEDVKDFLYGLYIDSAEPREKRIGELEEKNRELRDSLCNVANNVLDSWCRNKDDYCPHLAKLEKENINLRDNYEQFKAIADPEIERLQNENAELRNNGFTVSAMTEQQLKVALKKGEQLEKENAELKDYNKKLLQSDIDKQNKIVLLSQKVNDLQKKNAELKVFRQDCVKLTEDNVVIVRQRAETSKQLTKAKEIIKEYTELKYKPCAVGNSVNMLLYDNICAEAEQFLNSEVEK